MQKGQIEVLISGVCFGFLGFFGHFAFSKNVAPFELLSLRFLLAGLVMLSLILICTDRFQKYPRRKIFNSLLMGAFGYAVFSSCYFLALQGLSASMAVLLLYTYPIFVVIGNFVQDRRAFTGMTWVLLVGSIMGIGLLVGGDFQVHRWLAFAIGLASGVTYSIYILGSSKWLRDADVLVSSSFIQLGAGFSLFVLAFREPSRVIEVIQLVPGEILGLAIICSVIPITLFQLGVQNLKEWEVSLLSTTESVTALVVSAVFLNERISSLQWLGGGLVLLSLVGTATLKRRAFAPKSV